MIENIKMVQDFVLVQVDPPEERTASGLVIPDTGKERNNKGYVVAVGPGRRKFPVTVSVGDRVMWKPYDGRTYREVVSGRGAEFVRLRNDDITATL